ncbi:NAD(P)H-hydrate dehydratase [Larsenimonas rhizosphaerae]|uniref:NAD(P)H-hydrate dehydratase n=1 Tax=Larsenimonas rhizosphaerae TaxID=2944682 RepID=UPI002034A3B8|nr:NAD(P)H-hydrate dehydratase [Larsenimonas rhizosphaerae]
MSFDRSIRLYTADQARELDRQITDHGLTGLELMRRAGMAAWRLLRQRWPDVASLSVLCGGGNNAGDGYVVAALARQAGLRVQVVALKAPQHLTGEAQGAWHMARDAGVHVTPWHPQLRLDGALVVDALLGIGVQGPLRAPYDAAIDCINRSNLPVLALDVPSGVNADTGQVEEAAVCADITMTFIGRKVGLYTGSAVDHVGECVFASLDASMRQIAQVPWQATLLNRDRIAHSLPRRRPSTHKGQCGHALVIGGRPGYGGATIMVAEACARLGAGLVSLATDEIHIAPALTRRPELMVRATRNAHDIKDLLDAADVIAIGPGLGQGAWGQGLMAAAVQRPAIKVIDADGLHLLRHLGAPHNDHQVLTPHPGEAAALLSCSVAEVQADRCAAVRELQSRYGGVVLLKGAGTLVAGEDGDGEVKVYLNPYGNPGMATGGMGDTLTGFITAMLAQGLSLLEATLTGTLLHGCAADKAAADAGERGLLATDLASFARRMANPQ